ncbi:hypothetical protein LTR64_007437 [Lithohypha guttulata]|uniref:uncharacterized protein n=1 Tax=Lithohypha guttulata TaxID=1690604 RepID=UPI002DDDF1C8|nr:hypothetical protein LTR51_006798 [Lithohypha guttulata]
MIDRYQPRRDDYYDARNPRDRDDRRRAPSPTPANIDRYVPGQEPDKPVIRLNPVQNPLVMDTQAGFSYFAEWWRNEQQLNEDKERAKHGGRRPSDRLRGENESRIDREKERAKIQEAYDSYKQDFQVKAARQFVQLHKSEEWFKERYVPEVRDSIRKRLVQFRDAAFEQWKSDIDAGIFDEFTLEGIYKHDSDGAGGMVEKEEGEAIGGAETLGVQDLVPAKGGDLKDEAMNQPALLIKTLAPNVARTQIEDFCKEHLGEGDGGFRWLSLSDPNPIKKFHRIGWIMLNPAPEENDQAMEDVGRGEGREDGEEDDKPKSEPSSAAQKALEAINGKTIVDPVRGDFTCHVGVHNAPAQPRKKALWDLFSAPERIERDYQLARRLVTRLEAETGKDEASGGLAMIDARVEDMRSRGLLQPAPKPPKKNAFADNDDEIKFEEGEEIEGEEEDDSEELLVVKKKLDLLVEYLRRVFNFCLFCVFESDSVHELVRKCPGGHLRRPRAGLSKLAKKAAIASANGDPFPKTKEGTEDGSASPVEDRKGNKFNRTEQQLLKAFNWVKTFEEKVLQLLEPEYCDLKKIGGKPVEEAVEEELNKYVKQEDESKYRCKVPDCTKLFKAEHFWKKHVEKRHEEWYEGLKNDLNLVNTYVLDPSHIAPSRSDANSNGHFPLPANHQFTNGTPRGFNLQNMMSFGQNMMNSAGFAPGPQGANGNMNGGSNHNTGPIRRGGGRFNNNRQNPYDKNNRRGYGNMGFIAQGGGGSGGRWGDGAGQPMNVIGPKEAVQGRAIRSYDDLDAPPAGGSNDRAAATVGDGGDTLDY